MRKREGMFFHGTAKKLVAAVAVAGLVLTGFSTTAVAAETPVEETKIELAEEDATEIFSGDTNESYESSDASWLMKAADDDVITVVYTCTEKANAGWGVLGWGATINDAWKDGPSLSSSEKNATDEMVATMTVADFKKTMGITDSSVVSFIKLGAWNGGKIISLTVSGAENAPKVEGAEEIVIEGPKELNPADYLYLLDTNWLAAHENNFRLWPGAFLPGWNPGVTIYVTMEFESNGPFMGAYGTCVNVPGDPWAWQMEVFNSGSDNDLTCTWFLTPRLDYMDIGIWWMGGTQLGIKSIKVEKAIDYSGPAADNDDDSSTTPTDPVINVDMATVATSPAREAFSGSSVATNWQPAVTLYTSLWGGSFDTAGLTPNHYIVVDYSSTAAPELVFQADGIWAKIAPCYAQNGTAVYKYDDMVTAYGSDFSTVCAVNICDTTGTSTTTITSVRVFDARTLTGAVDPNAIFTDAAGKGPFTWSDSIMFDANTFSGVTFDGSKKIVVEYSTGASYWAYIKMANPVGSWDAIQEGEVTLSASSITKEYVLTSDWEVIATNGLALQGYDIVVTKVSLEDV